MTSRTLAVTGATGFVGAQLVALAQARNWTVRALVRDPARLPYPAVAAGLEVRHWNAADPPTMVTPLLEGADVLCHLAAFIPADTADPALAPSCFAVNTLGTLALLQAAAMAGVPRFVHLSTGNAYGTAGPGPGSGPAVEDHPLYPSARAPYYLASKLAGEVMVDHWDRSGRLQACILRIASVYGPGMRAGLVRSFAEALRAGRPVTVRDGGCYGADLVFLDDVAKAVLAAAATKASGPINVGSGVRTTTGELAGLLAQLAGAEPALVILEPATGGSRDPGFPALDITRARAQLGYRPTELHEGLALYLRSLPP